MNNCFSLETLRNKLLFKSSLKYSQFIGNWLKFVIISDHTKYFLINVTTLINAPAFLGIREN